MEGNKANGYPLTQNVIRRRTDFGNLFSVIVMIKPKRKVPELQNLEHITYHKLHNTLSLNTFNLKPVKRVTDPWGHLGRGTAEVMSVFCLDQHNITHNNKRNTRICNCVKWWQWYCTSKEGNIIASVFSNQRAFSRSAQSRFFLCRPSASVRSLNRPSQLITRPPCNWWSLSKFLLVQWVSSIRLLLTLNQATCLYKEGLTADIYCPLFAQKA